MLAEIHSLGQNEINRKRSVIRETARRMLGYLSPEGEGESTQLRGRRIAIPVSEGWYWEITERAGGTLLLMYRPTGYKDDDVPELFSAYGGNTRKKGDERFQDPSPEHMKTVYDALDHLILGLMDKFDWLEAELKPFYDEGLAVQA